MLLFSTFQMIFLGLESLFQFQMLLLLSTFSVNICFNLKKPDVISSDHGPGFAGEVVQWVIQLEEIMREFSAHYHPQCMGLIERSNQTIQDVLKKMDIATNSDIYLPVAQYAYNRMPRAMFPECLLMKLFMDSNILNLCVSLRILRFRST